MKIIPPEQRKVFVKHTKLNKTLERLLYEDVEQDLEERHTFDGKYNPTVKIEVGLCRCVDCKGARNVLLKKALKNAK